LAQRSIDGLSGAGMIGRMLVVRVLTQSASKVAPIEAHDEDTARRDSLF
jgi:hypothetical protein